MAAAPRVPIASVPHDANDVVDGRITQVRKEVESGIRPGFAWIPNGFGITEVDAEGNTLVQGAYGLSASQGRTLPDRGCRGVSS
jgi:hypothetical protein